MGLILVESSFRSLLAQPPTQYADEMQKINPRVAAPFVINFERVKANGIRIIEREHLLLFTDVPPRRDIEELPDVFGHAVAQWCNFFEIDPTKTRHWRLRAFVIENQDRFRNAGLMPEQLPPFPAGFQFGRDVWVYVQPGEYYTRHLLLHEGTHAFMEWFLGGWGSPWYSEGMAEKLALHRWSADAADADQRLMLNFAVTDKLQVPYWGRVNLVYKDLQQNQGIRFAEVIRLPAASFRDVRYYGWAWAACEFLTQHELTEPIFDQLTQHVTKGTNRFDNQVQLLLKPHWEQLQRDWELYVHELDFGIEVPRVSLKSAVAISETGDVNCYRLRADQSWQTTTIAVRPGDRLRISSTNRFVVGSSVIDGQHVPWIATADGITLDYYRGRPLGMLLAGTVDFDAGDPKTEVIGLLEPVGIGSNGQFEVQRSGLLCLRINDSPAKMQANQGALEVTIEKVK